MSNDRYYDFTVVFEPAEEGGYCVSVPALQGCHTQGETFEDAKRMAEDAIKCHIEGLMKDGLPVPDEQGEFVGHVRVKPQLP